VPPAQRRRRPSKRRRENISANQVVADQVRQLRERRGGMSQQALADKLGWTQSAVARLESGRRTISVGDLLALSWALDVAPIYLLAGSFQTEDVPVHKTLRVSPQHMKRWISGSEPLPGLNYRAYFENIPDDEWIARYGRSVEPGVIKSAEAQVAEIAALYERAEELLASGAARLPGNENIELSAEREAELAEERQNRLSELEATVRAKGRQRKVRGEGDDVS
jgi:transcriptional regulator with XRE-family HTH domain